MWNQAKLREELLPSLGPLGSYPIVTTVRLSSYLPANSPDSA